MLLKFEGTEIHVQTGVVKGTKYVPTAEGKSDHIKIHRDDLVKVKLKPWVKPWVSPPSQKRKQ